MEKAYSDAEMHALQDWVEDETQQAQRMLTEMAKKLMAAGKSPTEAFDLAYKAADAQLAQVIVASVRGGMKGKAP